jgi:hypothetical protein
MNGLNRSISRITRGKLSIGRIKFERNKNKLPILIEAIVVPSCVLKTYPSNVPRRIKKEIPKNRIVSVTAGLFMTGISRKYDAGIKTTMSWKMITLMLVIYPARICESSLVGVVNVLKKARDFFSITTSVDDNMIPTNKMINVTKYGNINVDCSEMDETGLTLILNGLMILSAFVISS